MGYSIRSNAMPPTINRTATTFGSVIGSPNRSVPKARASAA